MISPARFHSARRGDRADRPARRMGAAPGLHRGVRWPQRPQGRGQSVAGAVPQPQLVQGGDRRRWRIPACRRPARARNHRIGAARRNRGQSRDPASVARTRRAHLDGRFRHRLFALSYLRSFPFDKIKIDRSFVSDLAERPDCVAIVRAITGLGRSLGITTTAEGVETREQLDCVRAEGCNEVQGYLFSPPRPASELGKLVAAERKQEAAVA